MAALQTSGQISIGDLRNHFGDTGTSGLSEFYRGGSLVPGVRLIREPAVGDYYTRNSLDWIIDSYGLHKLYWSGSLVVEAYLGGATSYTVGGITYYRSSYRETTSYVINVGDDDITVNEDHYGIVRAYYIAINTGIPTSGTISLSQFYGAENS